MSIENVRLDTLLQLFNLSAFINSPTCYQSRILTCIDHILTNQKSLSIFSKMIKIGLSDYHKQISTTLKSRSFKAPPTEKIYRCHKNIENLGNSSNGDLEKVK